MLQLSNFLEKIDYFIINSTIKKKDCKLMN